MAKRGRPSLLSDELLNGMKKIYPDYKTKRSIENKHYQIRAYGILEKLSIENKEYLFNPDKQFFNWSVLEQLGRIEDDELLIAMAKQVCSLAKEELAEGNPVKTKDIELLIRKFRLGQISIKLD
jgi:hypothetical protein